MVTDEDTFTVSSGFIGNFKLGDNINHTLAVLATLYQMQRAAIDEKDGQLLCKPISIFFGSICEAILHDLLCVRVKRHTFEGVKNVGREVLASIQGSHIDDFSKYIASAKKHDLLKDAGPRIYDSLEELRKLRNRMHIQNAKGHFESDDDKAFTMQRQTDAEKTLEKVIKVVATKYPRPSSMQGFVADFELPWSEHFPKLISQVLAANK
jgi:hypothetical protein